MTIFSYFVVKPIPHIRELLPVVEDVHRFCDLERPITTVAKPFCGGHYRRIGRGHKPVAHSAIKGLSQGTFGSSFECACTFIGLSMLCSRPAMYGCYSHCHPNYFQYQSITDVACEVVDNLVIGEGLVDGIHISPGICSRAKPFAVFILDPSSAIVVYHEKPDSRCAEVWARPAASRLRFLGSPVPPERPIRSHLLQHLAIRLLHVDGSSSLPERLMDLLLALAATDIIVFKGPCCRHLLLRSQSSTFHRYCPHQGEEETKAHR
mmetsp:Transcript_32056/g.66927  ORF Transcript_32056/g.66927 Transcript_32056/m.66927 type:complete len:264 (-) Transcript_32056:65-856(-)